MTALAWVLVAAAGAVGAVLRHELTSRGPAVATTAMVNVVGAGLLGVLTVALPPGPLLVAGGGLLGSTTTFSTWMVHAEAAPNGWDVVVLPLAAGVLAAMAGRLLAASVGLGP